MVVLVNCDVQLDLRCLIFKNDFEQLRFYSYAERLKFNKQK